MYQDEYLDKIIENQIGLLMKKPFHLLDIFALENKDNKISIPDAFYAFNNYLLQLFDYLILEADSGTDMSELLKKYKEFCTDADNTLIELVFQDKKLSDQAKIEAEEQGLTIRNWLAKNMNQVDDDFGVFLEQYQYEFYRK